MFLFRPSTGDGSYFANRSMRKIMLLAARRQRTCLSCVFVNKLAILFYTLLSPLFEYQFAPKNKTIPHPPITIQACFHPPPTPDFHKKIANSQTFNPTPPYPEKRIPSYRQGSKSIYLPITPRSPITTIITSRHSNSPL